MEKVPGQVLWQSCVGGVVNCTTLASSAPGVALLAAGQRIGAAVIGTGNDTLVGFWIDPVGDGPLEWGPPLWASNVDPLEPMLADEGRQPGLYVGVNQPGARGRFDDFRAGAP